MSARPIIVTRAGAAGRALADGLASAGAQVLWLPAFEIGPAPDEAHARLVLGQLAEFDLAVFVSPAAATATAPLMPGPWPSRTAIGAVGAATRQAIVEAIPGAGATPILAPDGPSRDGDPEAAGGSEALWRVLRPLVGQFRRALILRAAHGREWLTEQLQAAGVAVEPLAVYARLPGQVPDDAARRLRAWQADSREPALVFASSEAVATVLEQLRDVVSPQWVRSGLAVATHDRIAVRARGCGFAKVVQVAGDVRSIHEATRAQ